MSCARDNVCYPRVQPMRPRDQPDTSGCVAAIALVSLCAACFWFGMWLGAQYPPPAVEAQASE